jgi:Tfp pilus assembly protein FimV
VGGVRLVSTPAVRPDLLRLGGPALALLAATILVVGARYAIHDGGDEKGATSPPPPADTRPVRRPAPPPARPVAPPPASQPEARTVTIRTGDTLGAVAERHDVTLEALLVANPGVDPLTLRVGQSIRLP